MEHPFIFRQISSLEKVFLDDRWEEKQEIAQITALRGERVSYQILYTSAEEKVDATFAVQADEGLSVMVRSVGNVPCAMPAILDGSDEWYERKAPGLYPDVLYPMEKNEITLHPNSCHSLFVTCEVGEDAKKGAHRVVISFCGEGLCEQKEFFIHVLPAQLPPQELIYTQWFHSDCIADYYGCEVFSEEHWALLEKFIAMAARTGINLILTPVFTPPLDTQVGSERPTVQLVDVRRENGAYTFGFEKLKRWIRICRSHGIRQFEISHLFTQWGTGCTPKIEAETENGREKIFGWHVGALEPAYGEFLGSFLPELIHVLKEEDAYETARFHVSDEPNYEKDFELYKKEYELLSTWVPKEKIMDAMSHYEFYDAGLSTCPVVLTSAIDGFLEHGVKKLWAYYCCEPKGDGYSNRFIAMPSQRNRILGFQLYYYGIHGFLHWGYNFYYSQLSKRKLNPFLVTDADEAFSSGDAFSVYPGEDGPYESLRSAVFYEAIQDYRLCCLLEERVGRDEVKRLLALSGPLSLRQYPREADGVLTLRESLCQKLRETL